MSDEKLERVLRTVDPGRRAVLKKMVLSAAFTVPIIASFSVKDLMAAGMGSGGTTTSLLTVTTTESPTTLTTITTTKPATTLTTTFSTTLTTITTTMI